MCAWRDPSRTRPRFTRPAHQSVCGTSTGIAGAPKLHTRVPVVLKLWLHTIQINSNRRCIVDAPGFLELSEPQTAWNALTDDERQQIRSQLRKTKFSFYTHYDATYDGTFKTRRVYIDYAPADSATPPLITIEGEFRNTGRDTNELTEMVGGILDHYDGAGDTNVRLASLRFPGGYHG